MLDKILKDLRLSTNASLHKKAEEYLRMMEANDHVGKITNTCKHLIAIEIACTVLNESFEKEKFMKLSGLKWSAYRQKVNFLKKILCIHEIAPSSSSTLDLLCISFEVGNDLKASALKLLDLFNNEDLSKMGSSRRAVYKLDSPEFLAAAFYIAFKSHQRNCSRDDVIARADIDKSQFNTAVDLLTKFELTLSTEQRSLSNRPPVPAGISVDASEDSVPGKREKDSQTSSLSSGDVGHGGSRTHGERYMKGLSAASSAVVPLGRDQLADRVAERKAVEARLREVERDVFDLWAAELLQSRRKRRRLDADAK